MRGNGCSLEVFRYRIEEAHDWYIDHGEQWAGHMVVEVQRGAAELLLR
jgi:hypothetical protein